MPVTLSDDDINELDRLLGRFRIDSLAEVQAVGAFIRKKAEAQKQAAAKPETAEASAPAPTPIAANANGAAHAT